MQIEVSKSKKIMDDYIIADNQDITKAGMMFLLTHQREKIDILVEATDKLELIRQLQLHTKAVIVLDYTLFDFSGANELIALQEHFKDTYWLLFSEDLSSEFLHQVLFSSNAFSVVMKDNSQEEILSALQSIQNGKRFICNHVSNLLLSNTAPSSAKEDHLLTSTEKEILKEIALGKTTRQIAVERNLSFHTINSHRKNIFRKLEVNNIHEATKYAMRAGIVDLAEYYI